MIPTSRPVALALRGLSKSFDRPAVEALDLTIYGGEFYALVGPNGAGKTTTLRMVVGLLRPDAGTIRVDGIDALADPVAAKQITAWLSDEPMIYDKLTPYEYLEFVAGLWRIDARTAEARAHELLDWLGLAPNAHERCEGFSKGMRQKVALAGALVHDPKLIILDEPLTGLDAGSARQVKNVLRERVAAGGTVIMTTHILEVAERMADRIGVIANGRLIAEGTLDELRHKTGATAASLEDTFLTLVADEAEGRVSRPDTLVWLAGHELRLGWRDWLALMTAGHRRRGRTVAIALIVFGVLMHLMAWSMVARYAATGMTPDKSTLVVVTGTLLLSWSLLLSQAMESVTRAFYARSDLDLILTSPVSPRKVFSVRIARIAVAVAALAMLLAAPFINVLVLLGGAHWLAAYAVVAAMGVMAAALAVALTVALFRLIGPKRTRLVAQIVAAVIGAAFVIGLQIIGDPVLWQPVARRAAAIALAGRARARSRQRAVVAGACRARRSACAGHGRRRQPGAARRRHRDVLGALRRSRDRRRRRRAGLVRQRRRSLGFRRGSPARVLRQKEWTLLIRDPWLMSQTLMQILYLLPPAVLLWRSFHSGTGALVVLIPVMVMAAGQLAGGLAWLSISGEDAPDLVASAPVTRAPHPVGQDRSGDGRDRADLCAAGRRAGFRLAAGGAGGGRRRA